MGDPHKNLSHAYSAVLFIGGVSLVVGLIAALFEIRLLQSLGLGWTSVLFGAVFLVLANYTKQASLVALVIAIALYSIDAIVFLVQGFQTSGSSLAGGVLLRAALLWFMVRGIGAIRDLNKEEVKAPSPISVPQTSSPFAPSVPPTTSPSMSLAFPAKGEGGGPKPISFVAPAAPSAANQPENIRRDMLSKSLTPEILNLRFVAYRCEITNDHFKAIYQNGTQKELKWFEVTALVIRQFPFQAPWEGKLLLDIVPIAVAGEKIHPVRVLSSTYVNYGFLPQGQSASTKENIRRLANYILLQNRSIFVDPGTDSFVQAGQPPVRFLSMSQFTEYDSRYG